MNIRCRIDNFNVILDSGYEENDYVRFVADCLSVAAVARHDLIYVARTDFKIGEEVFPLFINDEGFVHLELDKLSKHNQEIVLEKLRTACPP